MELTQEQRAILAHVLIDVDAWVEHAVKNVGEHAVLAKIHRWRNDYLTECGKPDYKNRAEREANAAVELATIREGAHAKL